MNTIALQGGLNTANANIAFILGIDATQNANIALSLTTANSAASNTVSLQGGLNTANANIAFILPRANTGYNFVNNGGTVSGSVIISGDLNVTGSITYTGNVTSVQIKGNTGQFFGYTSNGFNALYAGVPTGYLLEPQNILQSTANYNGYAGGLNIQNISPGSNASGDLFISADNGTINDGFVDLGIGSSTYNYTGYDLIGKNDGYLFTTGNTTTGGGNMIVGTGLNNDVVFSVGGINAVNEIGRFKYNTGLVLKKFPITFADGTTQNTAAASNAYSIAAFNTANLASSNTVSLQGGLNTANANIALLFAIDNVINTAIQVANTTANNASTNTIALQGGLNTANANIALALSIANTANATAVAAFNQANTDVTSISIVSGTYGSSSNVAVITVAANGRITSVSNVAITTSGGGGGVSASGYLANSIIFANSTGYLSNTSGLQFISTNNTVITSNVQLSSGITFSDGTRQTTAGGSGLSSGIVTPGTYGNTSYIPVITVDTYGRVTNVVNTALIFSGDPTANANIALALTTANSAAANTISLQDGLNTANANIALALTTANSAAANTISLQGGLNTATIIAQAAFDKANTVSSTTLPLILNDISSQFTGSQSVFTLFTDQTNITSSDVVDSRNMEVIVNGLRLAPYIKQNTYPWLTPYDSFIGFRVVSDANTANLIIYNSPAPTDQAIVTIINKATNVQTRKYPYSATTIALGD